MAHILAIDLGKFKSVACDYDTTTQQHTFTPDHPPLRVVAADAAPK